jgi:hypothetical protein
MIVAEQINILAPLVCLKEMVPIQAAEQQPQCGNVGVGFNNRRIEIVDEAEYQNLFENERQALARDCWPSDNPNTRFFHILTGLGEIEKFRKRSARKREVGNHYSGRRNFPF